MANRQFRDYEVVARQAESEVITSFVLAPVGGRAEPRPAVPAYRPGQHLVFRLDINGQTVLRNYSVSGDPSSTHTLRIAVKRETAPAHEPGLPAGRGSNHLHDQVQVGDILSAAGPMGDFVLDEDSRRPVVLLSGGVGITPMMCMLHRLVNTTQRRVIFIHACECGSVHAFRDEVLALAQERPGITAHFCYRTPSAADIARSACHSQGLISREQLQALLPLDDYDFYLCGPGGFMQANWRLLRELGVAKTRIHYEFFGPATVLEAEPEATVEPENAGGSELAVAPQISVPPQSGPAVTQVQFLPSGTTVDWDESCPSLLDLAEQAGLSPDFNCRAGLCSTCMSGLVSGEVEYFEPPLDEPPAGRVLLCCSRPVGPVVITLDH
jgi:ferredoxin-NADP reductase